MKFDIHEKIVSHSKFVLALVVAGYIAFSNFIVSVDHLNHMTVEKAVP